MQEKKKKNKSLKSKTAEPKEKHFRQTLLPIQKENHEYKNQCYKMFKALKEHKEQGNTLLTKLMKKNLKKKFNLSSNDKVKINFHFHIPENK